MSACCSDYPNCKHQKCSYCHGTGWKFYKLKHKKCSYCHGTGTVISPSGRNNGFNSTAKKAV